MAERRASTTRYVKLRIFAGQLLAAVQSIVISVSETATTRQVLRLTLGQLEIKEKPENFELVEVCYRDSVLDQDSERVLSGSDQPYQVQQSWRKLPPKVRTSYRLFIREKVDDRDETKPELLRQHWMDCHESVRNCHELDFDLESKLSDDDLCCLPTLSEQTLLKHLEERFSQGRIYTYVGEILIAVNPFRFFPMYNPKFINAYNNRNLGSLPPHIFAIADVAFHRMLREKKSQCVVISGESGSGKTESTKLIVHHLTALGLKTQATSVEKTILGVGPVLEAFGNASTAYNNNSSRFGKFTQIKFRPDGAVCGAALRKYLLEKSRIVSQAPEERNYHVFYYLLAGASPEVKEELHLTKPEEYCYLNQNECYSLEGIDEAYEFLRLKKSMEMVGFPADVHKRIFSILSAVLHIGNIKFSRRPGQEEAMIRDSEDHTIDFVCDLLMVTRRNLVDVLTTKKTKTRNEQFIVPYKYEEAIATRDAMAKALYGTLFDWIVLQVNHALAIKQLNVVEGCSIGVLDIFGFEDYLHNSFEQFCINFANEKLQFYFNKHVFKLEQDEYISEGIEWRSVEFVDNAACLDLISGRPTGLLNLIDEESSFPGATESSLLAKLDKNHSGHKYYEQSLIHQAFVIKHYAGNVKYNIQGFLDKNRDLMRPDILSLLKNSDSRYVRDLLGADPLAVYRWSILRSFFKAVHAFKVAGREYRSSGKANDRVVTSPGGRKRKTIMKGSRLHAVNSDEGHSNHETANLFRTAARVIRKKQSNKPSAKPLSKIRQGLETKRDMTVRTFDYLFRTMQRGKGTPKNPPTVSAQFQSSLSRLVELLEEAQPFFVRCIRSNAEKAPMKFDRDLVVRQLRYTGMLETVRIRTLGYQWRFTFEEFVKRYSLLFPRKEVRDVREEMPGILETLKLDPREFQIGKEKVFLRDSQHALLQSRLHLEQIHKICVLQRWVKGALQRKQFIRQKNAAVMIQACWRGYLARSYLEEQSLAALRIQSFWRMYLARREYHRIRERVILLQSHARGYLARRRHSQILEEHEMKPLSPLQESLRHLNRSLSDPQGYNALESDKQELAHIYEEIKSPGSPRQRSSSKVKEVSKILSGTSPPDGSKCPVVRQRSCSAPNSPESKRRSRPPPLDLSPPPAKRVEPFLSKLSPIPSPTLVFNKENEGNDEFKSNAKLSRKLTRSFRRRLSSKGKPGHRYSTSDVLDDRGRTTSPPLFQDDSAVGKTTEKADFVATLGRTEHGGKVKKGILRKIARNNSFRRKSDTSLNRNKSKKSMEMDGRIGSHDDLTKALNQTKIVSYAHPQGPAQWKNTGQKLIQGTEELGALEVFLMNKVSSLNKEENKRDTIVDRVFRKALQEFHVQLISSYSVLMKEDKSLTLNYEDLMGQFEFTLTKTIRSERISASFPAILGVNAFGGVLSEFIASRTRPEKQTKETRHQKKVHLKKRKPSELTEFNGHRFSTTQFSIPTFCEQCGGFIWGLDKGFVCQECRFTCHKKCHTKSQNICRKGTNRSKGKTELFGGDLSDLVSNENSVPPLVDKLIQDIEARGLYSEGLYRKSPSNVAVKKLKNDICTLGIENVSLDEYTVHVVAGVLKLFFRQLAVPVIAADFYTDFIRTSELTDEKLRLQALYNLVQKLPRACRNTLERLVFHLARITQQQEVNLMNANALAIIWAQCTMATPPGMSALEIMQDVSKQTKCLETLILGQLSKIRATINNIREIDNASESAHKRLSMLNVNEGEDEGLVENDLEGEEEEKRLLTQQLDELREQRAVLTAKLISLEPRRGGDSGEDMTSDDCQTDDDLEVTEEERVEEYAVSFDLPATPVQLVHLTKNRVKQPVVKRRRPTRAKLREHAVLR